MQQHVALMRICTELLKGNLVTPNRTAHVCVATYLSILQSYSWGSVLKTHLQKYRVTQGDS